MRIRLQENLPPEVLGRYSVLKENQLARIYEPAQGLFIAESPQVIGRALAAGYEPESFLVSEEAACGELRELLEACESRWPQIPVWTAPFPALTEITGFALTRGALCAMKRRKLPPPEELLEKASRIAVLEEVMNPTNVGAVFRSAAAIGMDAVLLTPGSADPLYRRAARVSMGTVFQVPWTFVKGPELLRARGFVCAALALREDSLPIDAPELKKAEKLALFLGTESTGLKEETIRFCDYTAKIPMKNGVDSLNVAAASAVAFWELRCRAEKSQC